MPATFEVLGALLPWLWGEAQRRPLAALTVLVPLLAPAVAATLWLLRDRCRRWAALRDLAARVAALEAERHADTSSGPTPKDHPSRARKRTAWCLHPAAQSLMNQPLFHGATNATWTREFHAACGVAKGHPVGPFTRP